MAKGRGTRNPNADETFDEASLGDGAEAEVTSTEGQGMSETETQVEAEIDEAAESGVQVETTVRVMAPNLAAVAAYFEAKARKHERAMGGGAPARGAAGAKRNEAKTKAAIYREVAEFLAGVTLTG
jgi:hypothetical protein